MDIRDVLLLVTMYLKILIEILPWVGKELCMCSPDLYTAFTLSDATE